MSEGHAWLTLEALTKSSHKCRPRRHMSDENCPRHATNDSISLYCSMRTVLTDGEKSLHPLRCGGWEQLDCQCARVFKVAELNSTNSSTEPFV